MDSVEILVGGGVAAVLASVAGGGLKAFGVELPLLATVKRQMLVMIVGAGLIALGLMSGAGMLKAPAGGGGGPAKATAGLPAETNLAAGPATEANASVAKAPAPAPPAESAPRPDRPEVPNIVEMEFPAARRFLIQNGWAPIYSAATPLAMDEALGFRGEEISEAGFGEAVSCSGTGKAPCLFRYRNPRGFVLEVVTVGEDVKTAQVNGATVLDCSERPKPEGC